MAYFIQCDVKGCDEIVPVPNLNITPKNWRIVVFAEPDVEKQQIARERMGLSEEVMVAQNLVVRRSVHVCPNHELPEFDDEMPFANELMPMAG